MLGSSASTVTNDNMTYEVKRRSEGDATNDSRGRKTQWITKLSIVSKNNRRVKTVIAEPVYDSVVNEK
jgi:hypothetical protein